MLPSHLLSDIRRVSLFLTPMAKSPGIFYSGDFSGEEIEVESVPDKMQISPVRTKCFTIEILKLFRHFNTVPCQQLCCSRYMIRAPR